MNRAEPAVLFAIFRELHTCALMRAAAQARLRDGRLHVLRVQAPRSLVNMLFPQRNITDVVDNVKRAGSTDLVTRTWLDDELRDTEVAASFTVVEGSFVEEVARHAAQIGAQLIVVGPEAGFTGKVITSLVLESGVPVLVAHPSTKDSSIVAATDLTHADLPVLRAADKLGRLLDARVIAVHNVPLFSVVAAKDMVPLAPVLPVEPALSARETQLTRASERMAADMAPVVVSQPDTVQAILGQARAHDADIVVVGARANTWLGRLTTRNIAAKVVARADRSVLVLPIPSKLLN